MPEIQIDLKLDAVPLVRLESRWLQVDVAPTVGGRVISLVEKNTGYDFMWRNSALRLELLPTGSEYDPNFYGGIDELLPNDLAEPIDGIDCPDHGELWTTPLAWEVRGPRLKLRGALARFGLIYEREMTLSDHEPVIEFQYRIANPTAATRHFLWKLHAALAVEPGDIIECPARTGQVVDLEWSRCQTVAPFAWPRCQGQPVNIVPPADGTMDFFYLSELAQGTMTWRRPCRDLQFEYQFDRRVFPYAWLFATYGGFRGHYTIILEPCTTMPMSVNEAARKSQCSVLGPGEVLETLVRVYAGPGQRQESPS